MKYRVTCQTPTLVGDGQRLSPIDYMVWKDHVNVLDQRRIFRLLSKGPRLEGYLAQLRKADRLDFASWGGFAQNFAGRRIPFEHASATQIWQNARTEHLFIPTFAAGPGGAYLPGSALKGALRTGVVAQRWNDTTLNGMAERAKEGERAARNVAAKAEDAVLGGPGANRMKRVAIGDSAVTPFSGMKVYLARVATLASKGTKLELAWKRTGPGSVSRAEEATPIFVEMAAPGVFFEGSWREKSTGDRQKVFEATNQHSAKLLALQRAWAENAGLLRLRDTMAALEDRLTQIAPRGDACLLSLGWGGGLLGKSAWLDTGAQAYRELIRQLPFYARAIQSGLPFPKTRKIVFLGGQPASLAGWVLLQVG
jgi:CRISPR-associated protein Csm5